METTYDMPIRCFQFISINPTEYLTKTAYNLYKKRDFLSSFVIEIACT